MNLNRTKRNESWSGGDAQPAAVPTTRTRACGTTGAFVYGLLLVCAWPVEGASPASVSPDQERCTFSADGRLAVVATTESLDVADTNRLSDIYLLHRDTGDLSLLSRPSHGRAADGASFDPAISSDGRWVVMTSEASNLVDRDANRRSDVFLIDVASGQIRRASAGHNGVEADGASSRGCVSADGRYVAFQSLASNLAERDGNGRWDVYLHDMLEDRMARVSTGLGQKETDADSRLCGMTGNGRFVLFESDAWNLVKLDNNKATDVFVFSRLDERIQRVSIGSDDKELAGSSRGLGISVNGKSVAFRLTESAGRMGLPGTTLVRDLRIGMTTVSAPGEPRLALAKMGHGR